MYLVVSRWQALPGKEQEFEATGKKMREEMKNTPGVKITESFRSNGVAVVVHGYQDEDTYNRIVKDPNGPFERALKSHGLEAVAEWLGSDKGETVS